MKKYDHIMIGFGKGSKTLAGALAAKGASVAIIEQSEKMFGGTCINVACIPSKFLENQAQQSFRVTHTREEKRSVYAKAIQEKRELTAKLRKKNYEKSLSQGVEVIVGNASFEDAHRIKIQNDSEEFVVYGEHIFINTGARPFIPPISGIKESKHVYTSETLMELDTLPEKLLIIGGGYIGLEFASYYANFGSAVTIIQDGAVFIPREDEEISGMVYESLKKRVIDILFSAKILSIEYEGEQSRITISHEGDVKTVYADTILAATGRVPNTQDLQLDRAGVKLDERGAVLVNEYLQTSAPNIWAMGDVKGGLQFTYISLDDSRIVKEQFMGNGQRTTKNRGAVPYTVFLNPPLSRVGFTEKEAKEKGFLFKTAKLPVMAIPKAQVLQKPEGMMKVLVEEHTDRILGAHFFAVESYEMINLVKLAMDQNILYPVLRDAIYTHPTMSESFNDLFALL